MCVWIYLCAPSGTGLTETVALAQNSNVIVRSFYRNTQGLASQNNARKVASGDRLILAFVDHGQVLGAVPFVLVPAKDIPDCEALANHPDRPGHDPGHVPNVYGVAQQYLANVIENAGYNPDRQDPKVKEWTVLCVAEQKDWAFPEVDALQTWYDKLGDKKTALHPAPSEQAATAKAYVHEERGIPVAEAGAAFTGRNIKVSEKLSPFLHNAVGVDFSGGKNPELKIWLAEVEPVEEGRRLSVVRLRNNFTYGALVNEIALFKGSGVLIDFPFGLAQSSVNNLMANQGGSPVTMWQTVANQGAPDAFRFAAKGGLVGPGTEVAHRRGIDVQCQTPFAPVNLRLAAQTFYGMSKVLLPLSGQRTAILPWSQVPSDSKWVAEGCPSSTLRSWGIDPTGYKWPAPNHQAIRGAILDTLVHSGLVLDEPTTNLILTDKEGDALDALVLAIAASRIGPKIIAAGLAWLALHPTEGFIYI